MLPFHEAVKDDFESVNELIIEQLHSRVDLVENIGHYIVEAGGKRLRPLLVLLCARALEYNGKRHIELATIIEFIHTATLLHDDVVDISELRRNRPTVNAKWGNAPSVLVGDFLYSRAFQMMVAIGNMDIMAVMSDATNTIAEGEVLQLVNAGDPDTTEEAYRKVIHFKTAKLFEAAAELAAIISQPGYQQALGKFGYHLGMAFQIMDDVLDYSGDTENLGKQVGDDLAEGKPTLPLIYAMQHTANEEATLIRNAILNKDSSALENIITIIRQCGALDYCRQQAENEKQDAIKQLADLPGSEYRDALIQLADFSITRSF